MQRIRSGQLKCVILSRRFETSVTGKLGYNILMRGRPVRVLVWGEGLLEVFYVEKTCRRSSMGERSS